jgi:hypothetical protein
MRVMLFVSFVSLIKTGNGLVAELIKTGFFLFPAPLSFGIAISLTPSASGEGSAIRLRTGNADNACKAAIT